uniref:Neprilysin n=1 Tax=Strongyloides stercoralis TaxID=6248 RepID=A0A0K0E509_STRER
MLLPSNINLFILLFVIWPTNGGLLNRDVLPINEIDSKAIYDLKNFTIKIPEITFNNVEGSDDNLINTFQGILPFFGNTEVTTDQVTANQKISIPELVSSINQSISPCDDFYDHVCSGWIKNHHIPEHDLAYTKFTDIQYIIYQQLIDIIQEAPHINNGIGQMIYTLYNKCLDPNEKNRYGTSYVMYKVQELRSRRFRFLTDFMIYFHPKTTFFSMSVIPDPYNSSVNSIYIATPEPGIHYSHFIDEDEKNMLIEYRKYLRKFLELLVESDPYRKVFKEGPAEIDRRLESILIYENKLAILANLSSADSHSDNISELIRKVTLKELQSLLPSVNWQRFFENILSQKVLDKIDLSSVSIYIDKKDYLQQMDAFLHKISKNTINDLLEWFIIQSYQYTLDERFEQLSLQFNSIYLGVKKKQPKKLECLQTTLHVFTNYIDSLYVTKHFNMNIKSNVERMVKNILAAFADTITTTDWMDNETKKNALKKADKMIINVGYSKIIFNKTKMEEDYSSLYFNNENMLPDIIDKINKWKSSLGLEKLIKINERNSNTLPSYVSDAYYLPSENTIGILAGALQNSSYNDAFPIPFNYGAIGSIIGHEITHGFDDTGSQYDELGNFKNWWDKSSKEKFLKKKNCFVDMYDKIYVDEVGEYLDGYNTQGENIADDGGIRIAYKAMKKVLQSEDYSSRKTVEGLEGYSDDQLFFLNYAFSWCSVESKDSIKYRIREDEHTIPKYRVNTILRNNVEFRNAFNCHKPDYMVSEEICRIF